MDRIDTSRITCVVYDWLTHEVAESLRDLGVLEYTVQSSRAVVLRRRAGLFGIAGGLGLEEEPASRIVVDVPADWGDAVLRTLAARCHLDVPGRGTVVRETARVDAASAWTPPSGPAPPSPLQAPVPQTGLAGLTCTVRQGRADSLVRAVLGLGVPMPQVTGGDGMGLRDKLGLIRVALPAAKDVVHAVISAHEAADILGALADAGHFDRVGSGFLHAFSLEAGIVNSMVIRGQRHSASIEQIIAAVDELKGSAVWRKRSVAGQEDQRPFLHDLTNLTVTCNEGRMMDLVRAATRAGAPGATIHKLHHVRLDGAADADPVSPAREETELVLKADVVAPVCAALRAEGLYADDTAGILCERPVSLALARASH